MNERIAGFFQQIAHLLIIPSFFAKSEQFAQKTDEQIPNPDGNMIYTKK